MHKTVLVVVAHPDDEVLGFGGTAKSLTAKGDAVTACILAGAVHARNQRPSDADLADDTRSASRLLGMNDPIIGDFPNIRMNSVPHLDLVQFIEGAISITGSQWIFTHHPHDQNDDHRQVSAAAQAAARLSQRGHSVGPLKGLFFMEIASATDWQFAGAGRAFEPNSFFPIGEAGLSAKLDALAAYRNVMRPFPHPRSSEVITSHAIARGAQAGHGPTEAFQCVYLDLSDT